MVVEYQLIVWICGAFILTFLIYALKILFELLKVNLQLRL
jgi:beta-lactamase regulating signal transducer with metallopeptidase domain